MLDNMILAELHEYIEMHLSSNFISFMPAYDLENFIKDTRKPSFYDTLCHFIDIKNTSDVSVYKKAGLDRRHFSKIRSSSNYRPSKKTVFALALALKLDECDTERLLKSAGYSLSESEEFDLVIRFCLMKKIYDIDEVNQALENRNQSILGVFKNN